jgi:hypothetical protein
MRRSDQVENRCRQLANRVGRRGASLLSFGGMYILAGVPLLIEPSQSHLHVSELRLWSAAFILAGLVAWGSAFSRSARRDKCGFIALMLIGWLWVAYCALSSLLHVFNPNVFQNLIGLTFQNSFLMILILVTSGWPETFEPVDLAHALGPSPPGLAAEELRDAD